jgi:hypothetical protein
MDARCPADDLAALVLEYGKISIRMDKVVTVFLPQAVVIVR